MSSLNDIKAYLRDINLKNILTDNDLTTKIDISKRYNNRFRFFYPNKKLIKYVTKIGGVLVGSRAIRCYTIAGKPLIERKVNDWDFIVTLDMAFKICADMGIKEIPQIGNVISIKNQRRWVHPGYEESYRVGVVDVQLIINEELPEYVEIRGVRISNFGYLISQKIKIANELQPDLFTINLLNSQYQKHISDMVEIIIKFNGYNKDQLYSEWKEKFQHTHDNKI